MRHVFSKEDVSDTEWKQRFAFIPTRVGWVNSKRHWIWLEVYETRRVKVDRPYMNVGIEYRIPNSPEGFVPLIAVYELLPD